MRDKVKLRVFARSLGRSLGLVWRSGRRLTVAHAALAATQALLPLLTLYALKRAVDAATAAARLLPRTVADGASWRAALQHSAGREVAAWFVIGAVAMGLAACLRSLAAWVGEQHAMAVSDRVHARLHGKLLDVDLAFFEDCGEQNRLYLAQAEAMTRPIGVLDSLFRILQGGLGFLGILMLLATLHPMVAIVMVAAGIPLLLFRLHRGRRMYEWRRSLAPLEREAGYFHHLLTSGDVAKELRLQGHGGFCRRRFEEVRLRLRRARLAWRRYVLTRELAVQFAMLAVGAALLLWMTGRLLSGALTLGALIMYAQAIQRGQGQLGMLISAVVDVYQSALFLQAFEELMDHPVHVAAPAIPRPSPTPIRRGVAFESVDFVYPGTDRRVLRDLSFELRPGECLGLVGANGAGKSTIVKLLCRLYDPTAGRILVDGIDLRELDPAEWRRRIGVLFQDFGRYQLTAAENIWIGDPRGTPGDPRVEAVARRTGLDAIVRTWPNGLSTPLGRWLHAGTEPSAGQWQRIAVARAMLREADLLILDEPTSALDVRTQHDVIRMLRSAAAARMALVVSHRPEMLSWTQRVVVLADGTVAESGSISELGAHDGEFARLFAE